MLDLRAGVLRRRVDWVSPAGRRVRIGSTRLVSFTQRAVAAIDYTVEAVDSELRSTLQSGLVANEAQPETPGDPRVAAVLDRPLAAEEQDTEKHGGVLLHGTRVSGLLIAAGMDHEITAPGDYDEETDVREDWSRTTVVTMLRPGQQLRVVKYLGYGWSATRSPQALRDQAAAALTGARYTGSQGLSAEQGTYPRPVLGCRGCRDRRGPGAAAGDPVRSVPRTADRRRAERRAIPAKGLTGPEYDGHAFWDTEGFVLPLLIYAVPDAAADTLRWRRTTLNPVRRRARTLGLSGAAFPWRTIHGEECSAYWPAGTAALHLNAVVARAVDLYRLVTGDAGLMRDCGLEILVEPSGCGRRTPTTPTTGAGTSTGSPGPDEHSAVVDDNTPRT